jgi:hypothetical protein
MGFPPHLSVSHVLAPSPHLAMFASSNFRGNPFYQALHASIQLLDVHFPTTDSRILILSNYTEPNPDQRLLLERLGLTLPPQPPPRITTAGQLVH